MANPSKSGLSAKQWKLWIASRLEQVNSARQAHASANDVAYYASSLSGFTEEAIEGACAFFEKEELAEGRPWWPELPRFQAKCRSVAMAAKRRRDPPCKTCSSERMVVKREGIRSWAEPCPACRSGR